MMRFPRARIVMEAERGTTLVEMAVAMAILGVVMSIVLGILVWAQTAVGRETVRSTTEDQGRVAIESLDRDIRSGQILCVWSDSFGLSVYTQSNGTSRWVQYRVQSQTASTSTSQSHSQTPEVLQRREYVSGAWTPASPYYWRTVATGIVNTSAPFSLDSSTSYGSRVVNVSLLVNSDSSNVASKTTRIESSLAIRNQSSSPACTDVPSG
jgi:prepilin-type N-terminal cleavage/methylation domain-containing protein